MAILESLALIGTCWVSGNDLKTVDYFNIINDDTAQVIHKIDKNKEVEPHVIQTSLASSLISQIQTWGNITVKF